MKKMHDYVGAKILHDNPPPAGYTADVVDKDENGLLYIRLYADEINSLSDSYAQNLADWLNITLKKLNNSLSTARYTYEVYPGGPPNVKGA